jgi:hypothetical protein
MKATLKFSLVALGYQIGRNIDADDSTMTPHDLPHAFAQIAAPMDNNVCRQNSRQSLDAALPPRSKNQRSNTRP